MTNIDSSTLAVVGAGLGRTGTHSLKVALEQLLGGPCHPMVEVFPSDEQRAGWTRAIEGEPVDWSVLLAGYRAIVDWPGVGFWRELHGGLPRGVRAPVGARSGGLVSRRQQHDLRGHP